LSGVDIACWDLLGREVGRSVASFLGPRRRDRVRAYSNGWYSDCRAPEEFAAKAKVGIAAGFRAFKFDPFADAYDGISPEQLEGAVARVAAVRATVGPSIDLLIECHGRFQPGAALRIGRALEPFAPRFMEEPVHPELSDSLTEFRRTCRIPVALGERLLTPADFESFLARGLVDIIQPDITNSGGFSGGREIGAIATARQAPIAYHNAFGPIQTAATLQMDAVLPTFFLQESFEASWPEWKRSLVSGYELDRGEFKIPEGPGLGVEINEAAVERYRSDEMEPTGPEPPWVVAGTWKPRS
jgi:L-alanine-DL-glutamate epimerase-like enolase superfamily enzyme